MPIDAPAPESARPAGVPRGEQRPGGAFIALLRGPVYGNPALIFPASWCWAWH